MPLALAAAFALGGFSGAYLIRDGAVREWISLSGARVVHAGNYFRGALSDVELDTIRFDMRDRDRLTIKASREEALATGILFRDDEPWVRAMMAVENGAVAVRMRHKGLMNDHRNTNKWSYRIRVPRGHAYAGMTDFSIQHPWTRRFMDEWIYLESMRAEGLLAPRYSFANVNFNGREHGIFAVEEHVTSRSWLTTQDRRDGVIVRIDDSEIWREFVALGTHFGTVYPGGFSNNMVHEYRSGRISGDPVLERQRDAAVRLLVDFTAGRRSASEVFDIERTSRFLAMHELWSSDHVLGPPNAKFCFNHLTGRLEPIAGDVKPEFDRGPRLVCLPPYERDARDVGNSVYWAPLYLRDPVAMEAYVRELRRITQPEYLERLRARLHEQETRYLTALWREYPHVRSPWAELEARQLQLRAMLDVSRTVLAYGQYDEAGVALDIGNPLGVPVEVLAIEIDGVGVETARASMASDGGAAVTLPGRDSVILPRKRFDEPMSYTRFELHIGAKGAAPVAANTLSPPTSKIARFLAAVASGSEGEDSVPIVRIRTRILGHDQEVIVEAKLGRGMLVESDVLPPPPTVRRALERYPFLVLESHHEGSDAETRPVLRVRQGTWDIDDDLVLPRGVELRIGPGTVLRFAPNAVMLARGPVMFEGDEESPIVLEPAHETWPGLAVLQAVEPSSMRHVVVRNTRGIDRNGWFLTGGVTFYESPVAVANCRFLVTLAEDALNIVTTTFDVRDSMFADCASDALDANFSRGAIASCLFEDIAADAIDLSRSRVRIDNVVARGVADKVVSAGEDTHVEIDGLIVERARFAIASKDMSFVLARRVEIRDSEIGLAAFMKKAEFGPGSINASNVVTTDVEKAVLVQTDSWVTLNGRRIAGTPMDTRALYEAERERLIEEAVADRAYARRDGERGSP